MFNLLSLGYVSNNNNIIVRVYDNDFIVQSYGTPLNPTYGLVAPTIPAGYYDSLEGLSGNALKQATRYNCKSSGCSAHSYGDIWEILKSADINPENSNQVWMYYVESPKPKLDQQVGSSGVGKWVREHVFAQTREVFLEEHPLLQMESIFGCQQMQMIFYLLIQMHITYTLKMDKKILLKSNKDFWFRIIMDH